MYFTHNITWKTCQVFQLSEFNILRKVLAPFEFEGSNKRLCCYVRFASVNNCPDAAPSLKSCGWDVTLV